MCFYLFSISQKSWQLTLVYQTMFENYVAFLEQCKEISLDNWVTSHQFIIPKSIIDFVATLPGKNNRSIEVL